MTERIALFSIIRVGLVRPSRLAEVIAGVWEEGMAVRFHRPSGRLVASDKIGYRTRFCQPRSASHSALRGGGVGVGSGGGIFVADSTGGAPHGARERSRLAGGLSRVKV